MKTAICLVLMALTAATPTTGCGGRAQENATSQRSENMRHGDANRPEGKNRLIFEKSPYLLQHADNPVDWYPWGEEAFAKARAEDKPVFLSIGYSTCHWCHVMEHESFEDEQVAALLNDSFVCVKVDREERPDIDNVYMTVCQMITGRGGWPLTVFLTPDREPFYAATYIPKQAMLAFIPKLTEAWKNDRSNLLQYKGRILEQLRLVVAAGQGEILGRHDVQAAFEQLVERFDGAHGGFGPAPKFPTPHNLMFLLRYWKRTGDEKALEMVETTLERMRRGGVFDHVGFGFHRYSTDERWFVPHFEKMLYDQAMLVMAYTEAYQVTGKPAYRRVAEEIVAYVFRDITDTRGGFYSAEDADSEGEEGKFYVWTEAELRDVLGEDAEVVVQTFGVTSDGNWVEEASGHRSGTNILYLERPTAQAAPKPAEGEEDWWEPIRQRLFEVREKRVHPYKDDKILTDWNGLMIAALAKAARAFDRPDFARAAERASGFILANMKDPDGGLFHRYRDGEASIKSMVDDYAFFVWGLLELYETTFDIGYLEHAIHYNEYLVEHFWDDQAGGFFFTHDDGEDLIVRTKEVYDGAVPSGNSVAALDLIRLARITADSENEERARSVGRAFYQQVSRGASAFTMLMSAVDFVEGPSFEIVIAGRAGGDDTVRMTAELGRRFIPSKVVVFRPEGEAQAVAKIAPYTKNQSALDGEATAYVCREFACELPTTDVAKMLDLLGER